MIPNLPRFIYAYVCKEAVLERLRGGFPLSLRLIREIHQVLLSKGRGSYKLPASSGKAKTGSAASARDRGVRAATA